ncbi:hypothetical protein HPB49_010327 [Dermacentor silvarum]|uniref:Uncharacterized protein n=1 Tax=Dermacentor silvarum TaxID=543639 RepID=A0ACB8D4H5_DERSI|nr:hypothetical protein HPB49_010327 [Dermacentor silvarum]
MSTDRLSVHSVGLGVGNEKNGPLVLPWTNNVLHPWAPGSRGRLCGWRNGRASYWAPPHHGSGRPWRLCTWLCVGSAQQLWYLYTGRLINGFFAGMLSLVVPALIGELADARNRGVQREGKLRVQIGRRDSAMAMQRTLRKEPVEANAEFKLMERAFSRTATPSLHYWLAAHLMFLQQFCGANMAASYARVIMAAAGIEADEGHADLAMLLIQVMLSRCP